MPSKQQWLHKAYLVIFLIFANLKVYHLFAPESPGYLFYFILRSFDPEFYIAYGAHIMYIFLNIIHCIPLFFYIYRIRILNPDFWKFLFILRCIFEIAGQTYQANALSALYHSNQKLLLIFSSTLILPQIPSYVMCYYYAFRQDKLFS